MRRLPIFFVLDCSESMIGDKLSKMEDGLNTVIKTLRSDPHALETVYVSIVAFAGIAKAIAPLVEVASFYTPKLPIGGGTSLGAALTTLMDEIDRTVVRTTAENKGDWKPIVYLVTDGHPTDNYQAAVSRWKSEYSNKASMIAISVGNDADIHILKELTEQVILFDNSKPSDFQKFVNWISASVVAQSKSVGECNKDNQYPAFDESVMRLAKEGDSSPDPSCVTIVGRCSKSKKPYLVKYDQSTEAISTQDFKLDVVKYLLSGCYPIDESYFEWSDPTASDNKVNTTELQGTPSCPYCGNFTAFAVCGCGKLTCAGGPESIECPWCKKHVSFGPGEDDEQTGFEVTRGRG